MADQELGINQLQEWESNWLKNGTLRFLNKKTQNYNDI
jgi:hypothetical protein